MNTYPSVLNPGLYLSICSMFENVDIANEGQPNLGPGYSGEYYRVNCPHCYDTRKRLWINHEFGTGNDDGTDNLYLVHCYNEYCFDCREKQEELFKTIYPFACGRRPRNLTPNRIVAAAKPSQQLTVEATLPCSSPLGDPLATRARVYLTARGFDPIELERRYGVSYCMYSVNPPPKIIDRILIPVFGFRESLGASQQLLVGWQARAIGETSYGPKYINMKGFRKSQWVYGIPHCREGGPVVVVEGPTDVWRLGQNSVALFGKSLGVGQKLQLLRHFSSRPVVFMLDTDARDDSRRTADMYRAERVKIGQTAPVFHCEPPESDVAESSRAELWDRINGVVGDG